MNKTRDDTLHEVASAIRTLAEADTRLKRVYIGVLAYTVPVLIGMSVLVVAGLMLGMIVRVFWWALGLGGY